VSGGRLALGPALELRRLKADSNEREPRSQARSRDEAPELDSSALELLALHLTTTIREAEGTAQAERFLHALRNAENVLRSELSRRAAQRQGRVRS
jgi:hypothetical protein